MCTLPHTEPLTDGILHRIPAVEKAEIRQMINGPDAFTADGRAILGEAPGVSRIARLTLSA